MSKFIAIAYEGVVSIHAATTFGSYATLCALDGNDDSVGQTPAVLPANPKIDCKDCINIIDHAHKYKAKDIKR
jgi:hypothetical protein